MYHNHPPSHACICIAQHSFNVSFHLSVCLFVCVCHAHTQPQDPHPFHLTPTHLSHREVGGFSYLGPSIPLSSPVSYDLVVPAGVFWVASLSCISFAILRSYHALTAQFVLHLPHVVLLLHLIGAYSFTYVCIHLAYLLDQAAQSDSVVMMLRWFFLVTASFLVFSPVLVLLPFGTLDTAEVWEIYTCMHALYLYRCVTFFFVCLYCM